MILLFAMGCNPANMARQDEVEKAFKERDKALTVIIQAVQELQSQHPQPKKEK
jgi:hypothetical protein